MEYRFVWSIVGRQFPNQVATAVEHLSKARVCTSFMWERGEQEEEYLWLPHPLGRNAAFGPALALPSESSPEY